MTEPSPPTKLKQALSLPLLTLYGLGTIVGGGFYALVGKVAAEAGMFTPIAFFVAVLVALLSALTFGELAARYPVSAGEARYVHEAFGREWLSAVVGWMVITTGLVSAALLSRAFVGFFQDLVASLPTELGIVVVVLALGAVASWGIAESAVIATVITVIEVGGIGYVLFAGRRHLAELPARISELVPAFTWEPWPGIFLGAFLALYALIGFEDMVNVAEEVKNPRRNVPLAILLALGATAVLYLGATTVAVLAVSPEELAQSRTPLARVVSAAGASGASRTITLVSMLAGVNGALVQLVMSSRVLYGMASRTGGVVRGAPSLFSKVNPWSRTPLRATALITVLILLFAVWLPLVTLARITSGIILLLFAVVNLSLVVLKRREKAPDPLLPSRPLWVPILGAVLCLGFLGFQLAAVLF